MTVAEKKELVAFLRRGDKKQICKLAGVHETVMYAWISGRLKTSSIEPYVIQFVNMRKREFAEQTGENIHDNPIGNEIIIHENLQLKTELRLVQQEVRKFKKLISAKNRVCRELFAALKDYLNNSNLNPSQKKMLQQKIEYYQSDYIFLNHYEKYADILNTVNPLLIKILDELNPDFSTNDKRLLSMIKLNLSDHEIALIMAVSKDFIRQKSNELKQKLKLTETQSLPDFINSL